MTNVRQQVRPWRLGASFFGAFGTLALLLAAVGLYGVISYMVTQRTHEMGVRVALGAQARDVARLVVREGVGVTAVGTVIGLAAALAGGRFVESLLYEVSPRDPLVLAVVAVTLLSIAVAATLVPAWRAMRVDPVVALRAE
jgi:ABC-type antimicrobial peptide transport system permease subunit